MVTIKEDDDEDEDGLLDAEDLKNKDGSNAVSDFLGLSDIYSPAGSSEDSNDSNDSEIEPEENSFENPNGKLKDYKEFVSLELPCGFKMAVGSSTTSFEDLQKYFAFMSVNSYKYFLQNKKIKSTDKSKLYIG